ncbi:MAG: hypothetical protein P4L88_13875 [Rhodoferax sp.]|nr:hypothetical protein [Rhodoferax sp.]
MPPTRALVLPLDVMGRASRAMNQQHRRAARRLGQVRAVLG